MTISSMTMTAMESSLSSHSHTPNFRRVAPYAVVWICIIVVAVSYAVYEIIYNPQENYVYDSINQYIGVVGEQHSWDIDSGTSGRWLQEQTQQQQLLTVHQEEKYYYEQQQQQQQQPLQPEHHHAHAVFKDTHKPILPWNATDTWGFFFATIGLMIAAGGGIGGGGILVPIYILVMGFSPKHAIPLSNVTVLGGAVANVLLYRKKRHPLADRPLVDWDLILIMEPLTIAGALLGAFLNKLLPELLLTLLLVALLTFTAYNSLGKAIKMYKKENKLLAQAGLSSDGIKKSELSALVQKQKEIEQDEEQTKSLLDNVQCVELEEITEDVDDNKNRATGSDDVLKPNDKDDYDDVHDINELDEFEQKELAQILREERKTPVYNLKVLIIMFLVVLVANLLKGGGSFRSPLGIECGSQSFWLANLFILTWIVGVTMYIRKYLVKRHHRKEACCYPYVEGDIKWDERATVIYPVICCAAGFFAGMFGVGGGIVKGPLMLAMGVHPAVSSAASSCMILFTSFTATTSFVVFGLLIHDYAITCFLVGFVATYVGQSGLSYLMRKNQRNSYIVFSIGAVVLLSSILMTIQSLLIMAAGEAHRSGGICH